MARPEKMASQLLLRPLRGGYSEFRQHALHLTCSRVDTFLDIGERRGLPLLD
jgi:hypothetical protein